MVSYNFHSEIAIYCGRSNQETVVYASIEELVNIDTDEVQFEA